MGIKKLASLADLFHSRGFLKAAELCEKIVKDAASKEEEELLRLITQSTGEERRKALQALTELRQKDKDPKELERLKELALQRRRREEFRKDHPTPVTKTVMKATPGLSPDREFDAVEEVVAPLEKKKDEKAPEKEKDDMPRHSPMPKPTIPGRFRGQSVTSWAWDYVRDKNGRPVYIKSDKPDGKGFRPKRKILMHDWVWDGKEWIKGDQWVGKGGTFPKEKPEERPMSAVEALEHSGKYPEIKMIKLIAKTNFEDIKEKIRTLPYSVIQLSHKEVEVEDMVFSYIEGKIANAGKPMDENSAIVFAKNRLPRIDADDVLLVCERSGAVKEILPPENKQVVKDFFEQKIDVEEKASGPEPITTTEIEEPKPPESRQKEPGGIGGVKLF